jgi:hypothetical protein
MNKKYIIWNKKLVCNYILHDERQINLIVTIVRLTRLINKKYTRRLFMLVFPVPIIRKRVIIRRFINAGAVSPSTAKTPEEVGSYKGLGLFYSRLVSRGVLVETENNKYYVNVNKQS